MEHHDETILAQNEKRMIQIMDMMHDDSRNNRSHSIDLNAINSVLTAPGSLLIATRFFAFLRNAILEDQRLEMLTVIRDPHLNRTALQFLGARDNIEFEEILNDRVHKFQNVCQRALDSLWKCVLTEGNATAVGVQRADERLKDLSAVDRLWGLTKVRRWSLYHK